MKKLLALAVGAAFVLRVDAADFSPAPARATELIRMVRQDCGSCHGMRLTGGLGPALTASALADVPLESIAATIYHGRPGTPMPGWKPMLTQAEAAWIAARLQAGLGEKEGYGR